MAARGDSKLIRPAIEFVGKAVELGAHPETFTSDARYSALQTEPAFREALRRPVLPQKSPRAVQLVDPLDKP